MGGAPYLSAVASAFPGDEYTAPGGAHRATVPVGVDPTKALWRRIFAYVIDAVLGTLVLVAVAGALGDVDTVDAGAVPTSYPTTASASTSRRARATTMTSRSS